MMITEDEAKAKACHRTLQAIPIGEKGLPRVMTRASFCIGSDCMAWQWHSRGSEREDLVKRGHSPAGYCGLLTRRD